MITVNKKGEIRPKELNTWQGAMLRPTRETAVAGGPYFPIRPSFDRILWLADWELEGVLK